MDYELVIVLSFILMLILILGGVVLLFPLSRKLGHLIEARIDERKGTGGAGAAEVRQLASRLAGIEDQIQSLAERQEFLDRLVVERRPTEELSSGSGGSP